MSTTSIHHVENFIFWLTGEGKLMELLKTKTDQIPVIAESLDVNHFPYFRYALVHETKKPSEGVIKADPIPKISVQNGKIQDQDKHTVKAFVQSMGVSSEVAARVLAELGDPQTVCLCSAAILAGSATAFALTFSKNLHGDMVMWIRDDVTAESDTLTRVEYSEAKKRLPRAAELDVFLRERSVGHVTYHRQPGEWRA